MMELTRDLGVPLWGSLFASFDINERIHLKTLQVMRKQARCTKTRKVARRRS